METMNAFKITEAIEFLWKNHSNSLVVSNVHNFVSEDCWKTKDRKQILDLIAQCLIETELTDNVAEYFCPLLLELFHRIAKNGSRLSLFVVLSRLVGRYASATNFVYEQFESGFFELTGLFDETKNDIDLQIKFIESCYTFLHFDSTFFKTCIDWKIIILLLQQTSHYSKWLLCQIYQTLLEMEEGSNIHLRFEFSTEETAQYQLKLYELMKTKHIVFTNKSIQYGHVIHSTGRGIFDSDFCDNVVCVYGVLLERIKSKQPIDDYVILPSIETYLQKIALGVSLGKPTLVEGPMGCGKTSLIRHLANLTGREKPLDIMTIQISEQVDSKYLLGSYICTDEPGKFEFNLGPLLRAIQTGSWLILEDVDFASFDVISLINSIIESKNVFSIAGCENKIDKYDRNFRLFFTRRMNNQRSADGSNSTSLINMLKKTCTVVTMDNLNLIETRQLIISKWPNLESICTKIVDIYHDLTSTDIINMKRFITLRDLLKWCHRLSKYFKKSSNEICQLAFLDAIDCFVGFSPKGDLLSSKSVTLSSNLNISKSECDLLLDSRTPNISITDTHITIGRQMIERKNTNISGSNFAFTTQSLQLLERLFVCVNNGESVLLCGETGVGKTSCIQYLASLYGQNLTVINMNQQSDSVELFGGYKPIDIKLMIQSIRLEFEKLFATTFNAEKNVTFLNNFNTIFNKKNWNTLLRLMDHVCTNALIKSANIPVQYSNWTKMQKKLKQISKSLKSECQLNFEFIEGALTRAIKEGHWVLLDEINLAEYETLQSLLAMLENDPNLMLFDKAQDQSVLVHENFRLFACMNPATDVGKRELPIGIQNRFTEFYINEISDNVQLRKLVNTYIGSLVNAPTIETIVNFYIKVKSDAANILKDINGYRPVYSLRNLCRALRICSSNPFGVMNRSIYESFCLSFLSNLEPQSCKHVQSLIEKIIFAKVNLANMFKMKIQVHDPNKCVTVEDCPFPIIKGPNDISVDESYIRTATVQKNLRDICRIISAGKTLPILLQGETSVGKTSLITWLAKATGNICIRVNNHEHTDLQEYVGSYCSDQSGQIVFKEGVLVKAMRNGNWLILDELNLAPTEVLEALNRVLDDNRELFIPETQEVVKAHPRFLLFATQNPPGRYGGRKVLSRAFRNRFIELHFSEIPSEELEIILHRKCLLPLSYAKRMVSVLLELQRCRSKSDIFAGKHGLITLRDLFRWGNRYMKYSQEIDSSIVFFDWDKYLASQGYMLLAGRVRKSEEMALIRNILENKFKCKLSMEEMFSSDIDFGNHSHIEQFGNIVWTKAFKRLATLIYQAIKYEEPVLLVGETGCGKTTICQYFSARMKTNLRIINCHMNTESADFLGSLRPNRNYSNSDNDALFEWVDGPLIRAMKEGNFLLVDEISLADDSVLERLNSVLEPERCIFLAESSEIQLVRAETSFRYFATMNPGGDYGKKELSPALRDRFTEIWCPVYEDESDIKQIIEHNLSVNEMMIKSHISEGICRFVHWFQDDILNSKNFTFSIRDILTWVNFINRTHSIQKRLSLRDSFIHGAFLVWIDSLGTCNVLTRNFHQELGLARDECEQYLNRLTEPLKNYAETIVDESMDCDNHLTVAPFTVEKGEHFQSGIDSMQYFLESNGVQANLYRIMRALQLDKPILLEGPPGVGKTSLIEALAHLTGHSLIRINLSDQTDIGDLFGCDLPVEGESSAGRFEFKDGPLLNALKSKSTWILLDELNLASQTVLEGLNACLDHRGEIYIPELNRTFQINKEKNRIFASQNPYSMDGSRKGLPKSFLNRFTNVYIGNLSDDDFIFILSNLFPQIESSQIEKMVRVNRNICTKSIEDFTFTRKGGPFEFNLRDLIRWAKVTINGISICGGFHPEMFFNLIYTNKMRTDDDRLKMEAICEHEFGIKPNDRQFAYHFFGKNIQFGYSMFCNRTSTLRNGNELLFLFDSHKQTIESLLKCIEMGWMSILIGSTGFAKTTLIKILAKICGKQLNVFSVNSEMDTTDLLGGFEQKDLANDLKDLEDQIILACERIAKTKCSDLKFIEPYFTLRTKLRKEKCATKLLENKIIILREILMLFKSNIEMKSLFMKLNYMETMVKNPTAGSFEWKDSLLVKCVERGHWLLIDGANLLNASVLDRLNSLLESNGTLVINEKGSVDGKLASVTAHPNFRLFLTMNPQQGELSRAMRNRGIEIIVPEFVDQRIEFLTSMFGIDSSSLSQVDYNYSTIFRHIDDVILESQNGVHCSERESMEIDNQQQIVCLNHLLIDPSTFYVKQEFHRLNISAELPNCLTKIRLFLEHGSIGDIAIRKQLLNNLLEDHLKFVDLHANRINRLKLKLKTLLGKHWTEVEHLPIDFRENIFIFNYIQTKSAFSDVALCEWNEILDQYHLGLFCDELKLQRYCDNSSENSLVSIVEGISNGHLDARRFPSFIVLISQIIQMMETNLVDQICSGKVSNCQTMRNELLWCHQLIQCCHQNNQLFDWNRFINEIFYPLWFMFNEKVVPFVPMKAIFKDKLVQLNNNFELSECKFDSTKFNMLTKLAVNYLKFVDSEHIQLFENLSEMSNLANNCIHFLQSSSTEELNQLSIEIVALVNDYYEGRSTYSDCSSQITKFRDILKVNSNEASNQLNLSSSRRLTKSNLFITSLVYMKILKSFSNNDSSIDDLLSLAQSNVFSINPLSLFYGSIMKKSNDRFIDIFLYLTTNMNVDFNLYSIIQFLGISTDQYQSRNNSFITDHINSKSISLTIELLPLLSLTCFNIYQMENITIEEFFSKSFTLDFYLNFLVQNYGTLKLGETFIEKFIPIAEAMHQRLIQLDPNVSIQMDSTVNEKPFIDDGIDANQQNRKCFRLILVGYYTAVATFIDFPIDPIIRSQAVLNNCKTETELIMSELNFRRVINEAKYGIVGESDYGLNKQLDEKLKSNQEILIANSNLPTRTNPGKYFQLKSDLNQFASTLFKLSHLKLLCIDLAQCFTDPDSQRSSQVISDSLNYQHSLREFINYVQTSYRNYHDLITPFLTGANLVLKGLQLVTYRLKSLNNTRYCFAKFDSHSINQLLPTFFKFVNDNSPHEIGEFILRNNCIDKFVAVATKLNIDEKPLVVSLLKSSFMEIENSFILGYDRKYLLTLYLKIVELFVKWWRHEKQQEEMEKLKSEAMFHMKLADEPDDANLRQVFPSFEDRYQDLIENEFEHLDKNNHQQSDQNNQTNNMQLTLSKETLLFIVRSHIKLITLNDSNVDKEPDLLKPYFIRYQILSNIFKKTMGFIEMNENVLIDGHILVNQYLTNLKSEDENEDRPINVYKESLVCQTRRCCSVLKKLQDKIVVELLPQFENHPTLIKLLKVIERVYQVEVNSSLLSFAIGLELILKTAEDWQLIAHRGISLIEHMNEITELLVSWRKLEISNWSSTLNNVEERIEENELINWWFHFYTTLDDLENDPEPTKSFIQSVTRFIEKSSLGQFEIRLRILNCFVHHVRQTRPTESILLTALINLHNFYNHFVTQVSNAVEKERSPIEKEIKEFVKISKWNPNNFWSLKASLSKSHRQLYGYMKKYELALNKPANCVFAFDRILKPNTWKMSLDQPQINDNILSMPNVQVFDEQYGKEYPILVEHQKYVKKSVKLCRKIHNHCRLPLSEIEKLESVNNSLIEGINEYSNLKVRETDINDKEKWKKAVAHIQNQKRRAISDLFKQLTLLGLSFRKGLIHFSELSVDQMISTIKPLMTEMKFQSITLGNMDSCNTYFYKCISGLIKFVQLIENPNSQLTMDMIDRIKGFTSDLSRFVAQKRTIISESLCTFDGLSSFMKSMEEKCVLNSTDNMVINSNQLKNHFNSTKNVLTKLVSFSIRLRSIAKCLRSHDSSSCSIIIDKACDFSSINIDIFDNIIDELRACYPQLNEIQFIFCTTVDLDRIRSVCLKLRQSLISIRELCTLQPNWMSFYETEIVQFESEINDLHQPMEQSDVEKSEFDSVKQCHIIIKKILFSLQEVYIQLDALTSVDENEERLDIIKQKMIFTLLSHFNTTQLLSLTEKFFAKLNRKQSNGTLNYQLVCLLYPFFKQYIGLYRTVLALSFGSLKTVSKLLYVMLSLFNELALNGFCLPPEPNDTKEESDLKDIQNSGFGQGDTSSAKDVSDRLDCQDQLDELMKSEEQDGNNEEEENSAEKNEKNGIEMDDDFDAEEFGNDQDDKEKAEDENDKKDEDEDEDDKLDDKMGDVDNDEDVLDEKLWGDDEDDDDEKDIDDLNESEQAGGEDNIDSRVVANESNKDLTKNKNDEAEEEKDEEAEDGNVDEIEEKELDDEYDPNETKDKYKDSANEIKPDGDQMDQMDLPENIQLDELDEEDHDSGDEGEQTNENMDEDKNEEEENEDFKPDDIEMLETNDEKQEDSVNEQEDESKFNIDSEDKPSESTLEENQPNVNYNDPNVANFDKHDSASSAKSEQIEQQKEEQNQNLAKQEQNTGHSEDKISQNTTNQNDTNEQMQSEEQTISKNIKNSRSLAEEARNAKRQKIMESRENCSSDRNQEMLQSDTYRHVDNPNKANELAYDVAAPDECDKQQMDDAERGVEFSEEPEPIIDEKMDDTPIDPCQSSKSTDETPNAAELEQQRMDPHLEGEIVPTLGVANNDQSSFHSSNPMDHVPQNEKEQCLEDRIALDDMSQVDLTLVDLWKECQQKIDSLVYELCNQLQLVLEPTKCSKFKGDFKSGKRLNMRKVIAYVASDFRKDKIWLRRSKPSKRQYQIMIAVDDSLSMADNRSKQMAFESLILLGKSLSIIESGTLSVLSFGEEVRELHSFSEPFTDQSAFKMFSKFRFDQRQTRIAEMLQCAITQFTNCKNNVSVNNGKIYQLLLIVSDGRGMNSAGNENLNRAILKLKEMNIFTVFLIIDNPEQKNSIVEIRTPIFNPKTQKLDRFEFYIERFPFPYYVILKNINSLPTILGEALRQWFEMISHESN